MLTKHKTYIDSETPSRLSALTKFQPMDKSTETDTIKHWALGKISTLFTIRNRRDRPEQTVCRNNPRYWDRQAWANGVDPDQMPQNVIRVFTVCHSSSIILDILTGSMQADAVFPGNTSGRYVFSCCGLYIFILYFAMRCSFVSHSKWPI